MNNFEAQKLELSRELYDEKVLSEGISAYRGLAKIYVDQDSSYWILAFDRCVYGFERTKKEFENYLIELMNVRHNEDN